MFDYWGVLCFDPSLVHDHGHLIPGAVRICGTWRTRGPQNEQTQHEMLFSEVSLWREIWVGINWTNCHEKMNTINYCIANRKEQQCQPWFGNMQYLNMRDPILTHDHTKANGLDLQWLIDVDRDYKRFILGNSFMEHHGTYLVCQQDL